MKKTILTIAGAIALSLSVANAQEADRFVGAQHVKFQTACHPEDVKHYDTKLLRERFVMEKVMTADSILLTYSHYDRFIFGGAMPVNKTLKLENFWELGLDVDNTIKEKYSRRLFTSVVAISVRIRTSTSLSNSVRRMPRNLPSSISIVLPLTSITRLSGLPSTDARVR